jgi:hypothetical protein
MYKNVKHPTNAKNGHNEGKHVEGKEGMPAEEIADDEVEIGKTGGKPGTKSTPINEEHTYNRTQALTVDQYQPSAAAPITAPPPYAEAHLSRKV